MPGTAVNAEDLFARYELYRVMRERAPVFHNEETRSWEVFGHTDVCRVLNEPGTFTSRILLPESQSPLNRTMIRHDEPRHRALRGLVGHAFTHGRISALESRIAALADDLLDTAVGRGRLDVVADFAIPLPLLMIAELLGVEPDRREDFKRWSDIVFASDLPDPDGHIRAGITEMHDYFTEVIEQRRREPRDDLISGLVQAEMDGEPLAVDDLTAFCDLLLSAGSETMSNLIGNVVVCLDQYPDVFERVREDHALVPALIEETLRYLSPVQAAPRFTAVDVSLGGQLIPAGALISPWVGSANRDPERFAAPDTFDLDRDSGQHLTFGHGGHYCLGVHLARLQARVAITAMLSRLPGPWRVTVDRLTSIVPPFLCGATELPITWT